MQNVPMHVGQTAVDAVVADGEARVIDPHQVQERGMDVINLRGLIAVERAKPPFVALANGR